MSYDSFIVDKLSSAPPSGVDGDFELIAGLFPHQVDLVLWALRRGRAAIFADTGLGKTRMQVAWADVVHKHTGGDILILAPLAVAQQTVAEAADCGVSITHAREACEVTPGINITNYDRLHKFDCSRFVAVVLDESSAIKHHTSKTLQMLLDAFRHTPYKLCATATPAPNDWTELGTHAEFLGIRSRAEMLAEFFVHDGGDTQTWRLKGHARQLFWEWVATWGAMLRSPADLGHNAEGYKLPPLQVHQHYIDVEHDQGETGTLFAMEATDLMARRKARKQSLAQRVEACVLHIMSENAKLANQHKEVCNGMEAGIQRSAKDEGGIRPGVSSEKEFAICERQGRQENIHEGVLCSQPGKIQEKKPGGSGNSQCKAEGEIRGGRKSSGEDEAGIQGVGKEQPPESEEQTVNRIIRDKSRGLQGDACNPKECMRDMRPLGHEQPDAIPGGGSLPQNRSDTGAAVHELQPRPREVQGRNQQAIFSDSLLAEKWIIWCDLNEEQDAIEAGLRESGISFVSIRGSTDNDLRIEYEREWRTGSPQVLISKSSIFGWGLNWQHCRNVAFVGVTDSWESYYQAVRRCYRFGQKRDVHVHIFSSEQEGAVVANLDRKEKDAIAMADALALEVMDSIRGQIIGQKRETNPYKPAKAMTIPNFLG